VGKSFFEDTEEQSGSIKALTGALLEITSIERSKTKEKGLRMYVMDYKIVEPKKYAGFTLRDWIVVGTDTDPLAKEKATWTEGSEKGPGKLKRVLTRSGTPLSEDDEEWMEAAAGNQFVASVSAKADDEGNIRNRVGKAYRPSDEDAPEIGEAEEKGARKPKGKVTPLKKTTKVSDEDEAPAPKRAATGTDDDDEE
jgi:hypothetical protein